MLKAVAGGGGSSSGITISSTVISGGTDKRVLFDDAGVVGENTALTFDKATGFLSATGITIAGMKPPSDSATAIQLFKADGSTVVGTWDTTNSALNIGSTIVTSANIKFGLYAASGTATVSVIGDGVSTNITAARYSANASGPTLGLTKSRGTFASPSVVSNGDTAGNFSFSGQDTTTTTRQIAGLSGVIDTLVGSNDISGYVTLNTRPQGSAAAIAERMRIDKSGNVIVNTAAIATNATDGFLYIPTCAGTPTGTPTAYTGRVALIYDSTNKQFWIYDSSWLQPKTPAAAAIVTWQ